jgi:ferritin-like metal-binding protein YciE
MPFATLNDVFADQIADLYCAETQLLAALPRMAAAADDPLLQKALGEHLEQTAKHIERLRRIVSDCGIAELPQECEGMAGLLVEGEEVVRVPGAGPAKDAALIAAAQRVEHYEIAAYGSARTMAEELGFSDARDLLDETLSEESHADSVLTKLATSRLLAGASTQKRGSADVDARAHA